MARILVIDDEPGICQALEKLFRAEGHEVRTSSRAETGVPLAEAFCPDLVILDVRLPGMNGLDALARLRKADPRLPAIVVTAYGTVDTAVEAVRRGAYDYLLKPLDVDRILSVANRALSSRRFSAEIALKSGTEDSRPVRTAIVGRTPAMQEVFKRIGALALSDVPVLVTGEIGTGKELVARAIHYASARARRPFVAVSCGAVPEGEARAELMGEATAEGRPARVGRVEAAEGGTLFLDDVTALPPAVQVALLSLLEERAYERGGDAVRRAADVRVISAASGDLRGAIDGGRFREDLYWGLNVVTVRVPPLRERLADLPALAAHFLRGTGAALSKEALRALLGHSWPGNVRELRGALEHAVVLSRGGAILAEHLPEAVIGGAAERPGRDEETIRALVGRAVEETPEEGSDLYERLLARFEAPLISAVLHRTGGNQVQAAKLLGIHRTTLRSKIDRYGL
jgi:DNA-binding NtrC family response regulator